MTVRSAFRDKAYLFVAMYLAALFLSLVLLGWLVFMGGNPITVKNYGAVSSTGFPNDKFKSGDVAGIKRQLCSTQSLAIEFYPALRDSRGVLFPLPSNLTETAVGCHDAIYGFIVPQLPAGEYTYVSSIRFQNNLVGRDEATTFPPIRVRIMNERSN